jgi:hypothetical protein
METTPISIDAANLQKGQTISGEQVWGYFAIKKPHVINSWISEHGNEYVAKAAHLSYVLLQVREWINRERKKLELPPVVIRISGGNLNILHDNDASSYLNGLAFQGLRKHHRATNKLLTSVDDSQLSDTEKRQHQNRINVHSFIAASAQGAQKQLKVIQRSGRDVPNLLATTTRQS